MKEIPISINFDQSQLPVGKVVLGEPAAGIPDLHLYVLAPTYLIDAETDEARVVGYSLIHRDHLPPVAPRP